MQTLLIEPTNYSPKVLFDPSGNLSLKGRSLMLKASGFYRPLINWISNLNTKKVYFTIELDSFNSITLQKLLELLQIVDCNNNIEEFIVYWGFEKDDEEILLKGQILEQQLQKATFQYTRLAGV